MLFAPRVWQRPRQDRRTLLMPPAASPPARPGCACRTPSKTPGPSRAQPLQVPEVRTGTLDIAAQLQQVHDLALWVATLDRYATRDSLEQALGRDNVAILHQERRLGGDSPLSLVLSQKSGGPADRAIGRSLRAAGIVDEPDVALSIGTAAAQGRQPGLRHPRPAGRDQRRRHQRTRRPRRRLQPARHHDHAVAAAAGLPSAARQPRRIPALVPRQARRPARHRPRPPRRRRPRRHHRGQGPAQRRERRRRRRPRPAQPDPRRHQVGGLPRIGSVHSRLWLNRIAEAAYAVARESRFKLDAERTRRARSVPPRQRHPRVGRRRPRVRAQGRADAPHLPHQPSPTTSCRSSCTASRSPRSSCARRPPPTSPSCAPSKPTGRRCRAPEPAGGRRATAGRPPSRASMPVRRDEAVPPHADAGDQATHAGAETQQAPPRAEADRDCQPQPPDRRRQRNRSDRGAADATSRAGPRVRAPRCSGGTPTTGEEVRWHPAGPGQDVLQNGHIEIWGSSGMGKTQFVMSLLGAAVQAQRQPVRHRRLQERLQRRHRLPRIRRRAVPRPVERRRAVQPARARRRQRPRRRQRRHRTARHRR